MAIGRQRATAVGISTILVDGRADELPARLLVTLALGDSAVFVLQESQGDLHLRKLLLHGAKFRGLGRDLLVLRRKLLRLARHRLVLLLRLVQQHRREFLVADALDLAGGIVNDEFRIDLGDFFSNQTVLR